jgi:hypothetical protein
VRRALSCLHFPQLPAAPDDLSPDVLRQLDESRQAIAIGDVLTASELATLMHRATLPLDG